MAPQKAVKKEKKKGVGRKLPQKLMAQKEKKEKKKKNLVDFFENRSGLDGTKGTGGFEYENHQFETVL